MTRERERAQTTGTREKGERDREREIGREIGRERERERLQCF